MRQLLVMDEQNYAEDFEEICRVAVRAIIIVNGKLLLIEDNFNEVKFPGGGQENGETDHQTLIRETLEETGFTVIPESIREFGEIEEKRLSVHEEKIWHQMNRYYFCDIGGQQCTCTYTENEKKYGFHPVWYTLDEAIKKNKEMLESEGRKAWNQREYNALLLIKEYLEER